MNSIASAGAAVSFGGVLAENDYTRPPGYAARYGDLRFTTGSGPATHRREASAIRRLLRRIPAAAGPWLDVPGGAGRLSDLLPGPACRIDRDPEMLRLGPDGQPRACGSVLALPCADGAFAGVLCMRLLHHLPSPAHRIGCLRELARVSRGPVVLSFFNSYSLQHLRRVVRARLGRSSGRTALHASRLRTELTAAGLRPIAWAPLRRFISEQWIVLAVRSSASVDPGP